MTAMNESALASLLARELKQLSLLEGYQQIHLSRVRVTLTDNSASNEQASLMAVGDGLDDLVNANLHEMIQTVIAGQRAVVADTRKALLDYQFKALQPPADTPLAMHDAEPTTETPAPELEAGQVSDFRPTSTYSPITAEILGEEVSF